MRTRTIFEAFTTAAYQHRAGYGGDKRRPRYDRQIDTFCDELLRRMDDRDTLVEQLASSNDKITDFENEAYHQMEMLDG